MSSEHTRVRRAFDAAMDRARSTGMHRAELMATEAGRKLYAGAGFTVTHSPAMRASLTRDPPLRRMLVQARGVNDP